MDFQCSLCFLLIQSLINPLITFADMPREDSGPVSGIAETCLAKWSTVSLPSIPTCPSTHTSSILLCSASFTGIDGCLTVGKNAHVATCTALFCVLHYTSLEYCGGEPKNEAVTPSRVPSTHPSTSAFIDHEWFAVYISWQTPSLRWVHAPCPKTFSVTTVSGFSSPLLVNISLQIPAWRSTQSSQEEEEVPGWPPMQL